MIKYPACTDKAPDLGNEASVFDFGTSPHGLSADLPPDDQETPEAASLRFPAKPVLTFDLADDLPEEVSEVDPLDELQALSGCRVFDGGRDE